MQTGGDALKNEFPKRLKLALERRNYHKQSEFADKVGISRPSMSQYLNGRRKPTPEMIKKFAEELGVNELWLLGYDAPMNKRIGSNDILDLADNGVVQLENDDEVFERELAQEKLEISEKIEKLTACEVYSLNERFDGLSSIDDDDWALLLEFSKLNTEGKSRVLTYIGDLCLIDKYRSVVEGSTTYTE